MEGFPIFIALALAFILWTVFFDKHFKSSEQNSSADSSDAAANVLKIKAMAEAGDAHAQNYLGFMYDHGEGVPEDDKKAVKWYQKAAEQGHAKAQYNLGKMYDHGEEVPEGAREAVKWHQKAAQLGHFDAQNELASMYFDGNGVPKDFVTAYAWVCISDAQMKAVIAADPIRWIGWVNTIRMNKKKFEEQMTTEQIAKAKALTEEMVKKNPKLIKKWNPPS